MKKKVLSLILAVTMILTMLPGMFISASAEAVVIDCATEQEVRDAFASYGSNAEATIRLTADIILGTQSYFGTLAGTFDGQGHTIYNVKLNKQSTLFVPGPGSTFQNFTVSNLTAPDGEAITGSGAGSTIFGYDRAGGNDAEHPTRVINVRNERNGSNGGASGDWQSAFIARYRGGYIEFIDCVNTGNMMGWPAGGFIADVKENECYVSFINCVNSGHISSSANAGGFIGTLTDVPETITFTNCTNTGTISATRTNNIAAAGGFIGSVNPAYAMSKYKNVTFKGCVNSGNILADTVKGIAGGLIGDGSTKGTNRSYADTTVIYTIENCAISDCSIVAKGNSAYDAGAAFIGRAYLCDEDGNPAPNMAITVRNSTVTNVVLTAVHPRKFVGVTNAAGGATALISNCKETNYTVKNASGNDVAWGDDCNANCELVEGYRVATEAELREAFATYGSDPDAVIILTADIILETQSYFGTLAGTLDGQGHTFYNVKLNKQSTLFVPGPGSTFQNFTVSNLTAPDGEAITGSGAGSTIFGYDRAGGNDAEHPTRIINVRNERNGSNGGAVGDWQSAFIARYKGGYIEFIDCVNTGNMDGWPAGGFIADVKADDSHLIFTNCVNSGHISSSANAGGFIGIVNDFTATVTLTNCTNTGTISATRTNNIAVAGGLIGTFASSYSLSKSKNITLRGCVNTGDILADTVKGIAGGLIGEGNTKGANKAVTDVSVIFTIENCAVYDCSIVAKGNSTYDSGAAFIGRAYLCDENGNAAPNMAITVRSSYVSNVTLTAEHAKKFVGVTNAADGSTALIENCFANEYQAKNASGDDVAWGEDANLNCSLVYAASANNGFADNDDADVILGGAAPAYQKDNDAEPTKIRFIATLPADISGYAKVGYVVTATTDSVTKGWVLTDTGVYTSIRENYGLVTRTADSINDGDAYIFALTVENIPTDLGAVTFYATPFVICNDGAILFGATGTYQINH